IRVENGNVDIHCPGAVDVKGAQHNFGGPTSLEPPETTLPTSPFAEHEGQALALKQAASSRSALCQICSERLKSPSEGVS
ncbi:hypothetical protein KGQ96_20990, partial [Halomonas coralii]|uniref:DUF2345 domain-containing protein n=1 Tax=Modicisalibacter sp. R2A 31.J TaxID=2831898 RepID=UPI001CCAA41D